MHTKTLETLEYNKILTQLRGHAATELGRQQCAALLPSAELTEVTQRLAATDEAVAVVRLKGRPPFTGIKMIQLSLSRAQIGGMLDPQQCLDVATTLIGARQVKRFLFAVHDNHPIAYIHSLCEQLPDLRELEQSIVSCIDEEATVKDSASAELRKIRHGIRTTEVRVRERMEQMIRTPSVQKILQDPIITLRNDRFVLPVKQEHRSELGGIIHDQSSSGATLFIEPNVIVTLNNELRQLRLREEAEIERILIALSAQIAEHADTLAAISDVLAELDFLFAKAGLAASWQCTWPRMNDQGIIKLNKGRHPLIPIDEVVPLSLTFGEDYSMLIITGPNTGGKTVTLKTIGILSLMAMSGLFIPAEDGSEMAVFDQLFADIGDEQSIEQSLSTFSSHMTNIIYILQEMTPRSLLLLDELGAGTDPAEGSALAISLLQHIQSIGCRLLATTHYSELKAYAYEQPGIMNASMEFDIQTLSPTYRLLIGIPGRSNAFAIAERLGLPREIITQGQAMINVEDRQVDAMIASLEANRLTAESERQTAEQLRRELEDARAKLAAQQEEFAAQRDKLLAKAREDARQIVHKAKQESERIISELRQKAMEEQASIKEHRLLASKRALEEAEQALAVKRTERTKTGQGKIEAGDEVLVTRFGQKGHVIELVGDKEAIVQLGVMKMTVDLADLDKVAASPPPTVATRARVKRSRDENVKMELDLRGSNLEEALIEVDQFIDEAFLAHLGQIFIIHGKGTGVLRDGIQRHLRTHKQVKHYRLGEFGEGGDGVTVVQLK